jgi:16S rRNA (guanine527-N7)-methyltransferase
VNQQKPRFPKQPGGKSTPGFARQNSTKPFFKSNKPKGPAPTPAILAQLLQSYGVTLKTPVLDKLWAYHQLLRKHNHDQDLTRLIGFETIAQRHYADCMILHSKMGGDWPASLVDIGSGAGFPGIMIKLMSPKTRIVLAEPRPRRVDFLNLVIKELDLKDISVFGHKVTSKSLTEPFDGAITRAFEDISITLLRLGSSLKVGGKAIFMKGPAVVEELRTLSHPGYVLTKNLTYRIPNTTLDRALVIFERTE